MSAHDPASSFGAPGGAPFSWAAARWGAGASISRIESAIRVAALLTRTNLARTRCTPLLLSAGRKTSGPFSPYNEGILHERTVAYHLPRAIFWKNRCRGGGAALRLGWSSALSARG